MPATARSGARAKKLFSPIAVIPPKANSAFVAAAVDYARVLKDLADIHFAHAKTIVLVRDNLSIHSKASLYEAFPAVEARRLIERFEWHYTPKHGSWLNLAAQAKSAGPGASEYVPGHLKRNKSQSASKFTPSHRTTPTTTGIRTR